MPHALKYRSEPDAEWHRNCALRLPYVSQTIRSPHAAFTHLPISVD
jgi:hypothetical protein